MAKRTGKQMEQEKSEDGLDEGQEQRLNHLVLAKTVAKELFGGEPTSNVIFEVYERLVVGVETDEEAKTDILQAHEVAKSVFGDNASAEDTFNVFDLVLFPDDEDEDEEEE